MAAVVHLEGMGVLGSFIAWELARCGVEFTWHDIGSEVCAWKACTGAIFPTGDPNDERGRQGWREWATRPHLRGCVEGAAWWYSTKAPPHGAKGKPVADLGPLRRLQSDSMHFNAQKFVPFTREQFADRRREAPPAGARFVVAHGFNERLDHVVWGWARYVRLAGDPRIFGIDRPSLYCREGRFVMAYAYPIPSTPYWYAGSSLIVQDRPRALEYEKKYARWREQFERLCGGLVHVEEASEFIIGWRPAAADGDDSFVTQRSDGALLVRPMWHNGVRLAPLVIAEVLKRLEAA